MNKYAKTQALLLALFIVFAYAQTADDDEVDVSIPGYPHKFYSGYFMLSILAKPKAVHYAFFPSQSDISNDPLILWLTGGPGCSSLLALFHQNGPFVFLPGKSTFTINEYSWNKKASVLYLELPAGVGFSDGPQDQIITDQSFTKDAMDSLRFFFNRFPSYKRNDFYLTGHGYAGVYVAYLAKQIIQQNNDPFTIWNDNFKLKGILVGNPCVLPDECYAAGSARLSYYHYQFLYNRAYYSKTTWNKFRAACLLNYGSFECFTVRTELDNLFKDTNSSMYNIYDKCYKTINSTGLNYINTGCEDDMGITTYLNDPNVRQNWNIRVEKEWIACNPKIIDMYHGANNSYWIYPFLIKNKLKIWVYSGDIDSYIPIIGTKRWVEQLRHEQNMPVKKIWREWWVPGFHKGEDQVGGFIWQLRDFTFVTVKAGGFRTGADQPQAMFEVLAGFIAGKTLPYKNE